MRKKSKPVFIYLLRSENEPNYKIGLTNSTNIRLKTLQTGNSENLILLEKIEVKHPHKVETSLHNQFASVKTRKKGEWFQLSLTDELGFRELVLKQDEIFSFLEDNRI